MKYFVFSLDDGVIYDSKTIAIFEKYHIHATFNLNSGLDDFVWYNDGFPIRRFVLKENIDLYKNHEIASHTLTHPYLDQCPDEEVIRQVDEDIANLERIFNRRIYSFATPFDTCGDREIELIKNNCPIENIRISQIDESFKIPNDFYRIKITALDIDRAIELLPRFFDEKDGVFIYAGHSYDFELANSYDKLETLIKEVKKHKNIQFVTMHELIQILKK